MIFFFRKFLWPSVLETLGLSTLCLGLLILFELPEAISLGVVGIVLAKSSLLIVQKTWLEHTFFHKKIFLLLALFYLEHVITALSISVLLHLYLNNIMMWLLFILNLLLLKNCIELLASLYCRAYSIPILCCILFTPWFIILKSGLACGGSQETWIFLSSYCCLLAASCMLYPIFLRWNLFPCEWRYEP